MSKLTRHLNKWEPYFNVYEQYFNKFVGKPITMIEIGVLNGGSLELWREYFGPNIRLIGIDCNSECIQYNDIAEIYIGDQADTNFWDDILSNIDNVDIVLDDGGHLNQQQIVTFEKLFPKLNYNGVYICEDTHTSYMPEQNTYKDSFIDYSKKLIDYIHCEFDQSKQFNFDDRLLEITKDLYSINFYNSMVVFTKEKKQEFNYLSVNPNIKLSLSEVREYLNSHK